MNSRPLMATAAFVAAVVVGYAVWPGGADLSQCTSSLVVVCDDDAKLDPNGNSDPNTSACQCRTVIACGSAPDASATGALMQDCISRRAANMTARGDRDAGAHATAVCAESNFIRSSRVIETSNVYANTFDGGRFFQGGNADCRISKAPRCACRKLAFDGGIGRWWGLPGSGFDAAVPAPFNMTIPEGRWVAGGAMAGVQCAEAKEIADLKGPGYSFAAECGGPP